jgi:hypothetical protein
VVNKGSRNRTTGYKMKTTILIILSLITVNLSAYSNVLEEEFFLEDEYSVNDIPFNTLNIAMENASFFQNPGFFLEEEEYINDIPFNTEQIAANVKMENAMAVEFEMEEEETVNDIPFDTEVIAQNIKSSDNTKINVTEESSNQTNDNSFDQFQTSSRNSIKILGILMIILMSAYSLAAFLL